MSSMIDQFASDAVAIMKLHELLVITTAEKDILLEKLGSTLKKQLVEADILENDVVR